MKVAHVVSTFPPYRGGIGNVCYNYALGLSRRGHDVTVFTPLYHKNISKQNIDGVKVILLKPLIRYGNAAFLPQLFWSLKSFDVVHLHYPFFGGAEPLLMARLLRGIDYIVNYQMDVVGYGLIKSFFNLHRKVFLKKIINKAKKVIVSSLDYIEHSDIQELLKSHKSVFIEIPNGVDTEKFSPKEKNGKLLKTLGISEERIILFVGGLDSAHYFKGVTYLIDALGYVKHDHVKLLIVGCGNLLNYYKEYAESKSLGGKIFFTGFVPDEELPQYYNLSDIVVLPSVNKSEAFGITLIEAMACGKPVVASNLPGVRTVVEDGKNGFLVNTRNPADIAAKIDTILRSDEMAKAMGQTGRKKAVEKYSWSIIISQVEEVYNQLAGCTHNIVH